MRKLRTDKQKHANQALKRLHNDDTITSIKAQLDTLSHANKEGYKQLQLMPFFISSIAFFTTTALFTYLYYQDKNNAQNRKYIRPILIASYLSLFTNIAIFLITLNSNAKQAMKGDVLDFIESLYKHYPSTPWLKLSEDKTQLSRTTLIANRFMLINNDDIAYISVSHWKESLPISLNKLKKISAVPTSYAKNTRFILDLEHVKNMLGEIIREKLLNQGSAITNSKPCMI